MNKKILLACGIGLLALLLRMPGFGSVMTVDEENWMIRGAEFYDELGKGNIGGTFLTTHPGSIPMWLIGGGQWLQEQRLGIEADDPTLIHFRRAAVAPLMLLASIMVGLITYLVARLFSLPVALASGVLLAAEPYIVGMTTIAHLDGVQGLLMLGSLLAFLLTIRTKPFHVHWAVVAGVLCGLAFGFKLILALWLVPVFAALRPGVRAFFFVVGVAVLVLWLGWPALWVKDDVSHSLARDYATTVTDEHVALSVGEDGIAPATFYIRTLLGRVTPHVQMLVVGYLVVSSMYYASVLWRRRTYSPSDTQYSLLASLFLYSLGFLVLITFAAKKADRYALPALVVWPVIAGWVAARAYQVLSSKYKVYRSAQYLIPATLYILLASVVALPLLWLPHALAYSNPFFSNVRPLSQQGWGEGLEEAAAWLNNKPRAEQMYIASWYPSVMQTYFVGKTFSLSSRVDYRVQYVVTYRNMGGRAPDAQASEVLEEFKDKEPVHTVFIQGVPYVWIYETMSVGNFTRHVGELIGNRTVGQTVRPEENNWSGIDLGFATFSSRKNTADVVVHVRNSATSTEDIRTVRVNAKDIVDNEWQSFTWEPIPNSANQEFYVFIESPTSVPGNAITVRYIDLDVRPGNLYLNGQSKTGDIAYRIPE